MKSAVERFTAVGTLYNVARRRSAFTSTSCGWASIGSQKNIRASILPSAIIAPQLLVAAEGTRLEQPDVEPAFSVPFLAYQDVGHHPAGRPRTDETVTQQKFAVPVGPLHQVGLHVIMRYQRYRLLSFHRFNPFAVQ